MTQRYASELARARMAMEVCPECSQAPERHLASNAFWLPRDCDLTQAGVTDRIAAFRDDVANSEPT